MQLAANAAFAWGVLAAGGPGPAAKVVAAGAVVQLVSSLSRHSGVVAVVVNTAMALDQILASGGLAARAALDSAGAAGAVAVAAAGLPTEVELQELARSFMPDGA